MAKMSAEVDLLERLTGEDASLREAAFQSCYCFKDVAHAKSVVLLYLKHGIAELYDNRVEPVTPIPFHTGRWILEEDLNWQEGSNYSIRLTDKGYDKCVRDSEGFFDELFRDVQ